MNEKPCKVNLNHNNQLEFLGYPSSLSGALKYSPVCGCGPFSTSAKTAHVLTAALIIVTRQPNSISL